MGSKSAIRHCIGLHPSCQARGVHQDRQLDPNGAARDTWTIWLGGEKQGERDSLKAATELACDVAAVHSRPAWLLDETGYPPKPIERSTTN